MNKEGKETKYIKAFDRRKKLFGIKVEGGKGWYIEPQFEELGFVSFAYHGADVWFRQNGKYGVLDIAEKRVTVPAVYGFPPYFNCGGFAITWLNHKAGVIDRVNNIMVPFIYDEIECRYRSERIPDEERHVVIDDEGNPVRVGPTYRHIFYGFACFTNEGGEQAYDANCKPDKFQEWEREHMNRAIEFTNKEVEGMSLDCLEDLIRQEYYRLLDMGFHGISYYDRSKEKREALRQQEDKVKSLISDRRFMMNRSWIHNEENATRIDRTNRLLMRAVHKAVQLGRKMSKSLRWMEHISNTASYEVLVCISPEWVDSRSDLRYERKFKSSAKENDRLADEQYMLSDGYIWNIIATMGGSFHYFDKGVCFEQSVDHYYPEAWEERELTGDDGQSWDEYLHFPAYEDVYFTRPFHYLVEQFDYSFEDLCNINDFRVDVDAHLSTRERDK